MLRMPVVLAFGDNMRNIKLVIEYDGTNYHGWQSQTNAQTVQKAIENALCRLTGEDVRLTGAGRTDSGVHAVGQVANFRTESRIPAERFTYALNSILPGDIAIRQSEEAVDDFHARFSAIGKRYRYLIFNCDQPSALLRNRACHIPFPLDAQAMREAAAYFLGIHDFAAFRASGSSTKTSTRTMHAVTFSETDRQYDTLFHGDNAKGHLFRFEISGDGFLYNMVRIMAGTLLDVGAGKLSPLEIPSVLESRDRARAGKTAPPQGLYLVEVMYDR